MDLTQQVEMVQKSLPFRAAWISVKPVLSWNIVYKVGCTAILHHEGSLEKVLQFFKKKKVAAYY